MIKAQSSNQSTKEEFKLDHNLDMPISQNKASACHTHPAGPKGEVLEKENKRSEKVENPQGSPLPKEAQNKVSEKYSNNERKTKQKAEVSEGDKELRNLKTDEKKSEDDVSKNESSKTSTRPKSVDPPQDHKLSGKAKVCSTLEGSTETIAKDQIDITMSNEEKSQNVLKLCQAAAIKEKNEEISSKGACKQVGKREFKKDLHLLNQLKSLASNPTPGLKSNFNNNISHLSNYIEGYKRTQEKEISLAVESDDPQDMRI
eukprot:CAMPEP_0205833724 /NCGR_PEP_ID=MMETSP0206-20130828/50220_1 /ASSEMBLY_ACC=CAM_ASM_000279 /TAXON_ID=36767 /ORGANISM="Euplotes focardii, Strain TN1" /LENGTH=258 /DNA_ID=CAMNT_0053140365 /DNA_START=63 /DNA_END=840 /DNA_ORIENTATION=+